MYDERNNAVSTVLCEQTFKILWLAERHNPVLPELEVAHAEWEDVSGYYHPGISVEMLSIAKMGNPIGYYIQKRTWNCLKVKFVRNWTYPGWAFYYWFESLRNFLIILSCFWLTNLFFFGCPTFNLHFIMPLRVWRGRDRGEIWGKLWLHNSRYDYLLTNADRWPPGT